MTTTVPLSTVSEAPAERAASIEQCLAGLGLPSGRLTPDELHRAAAAVADRPELWDDLVVDSPGQRWWLILFRSDAYEVRVLSWEFDQSSGWHDHGGSSGGFVVTRGCLFETSRGADLVSVEERQFVSGDGGGFGPEHVHDVGFVDGKPAVSIHAYSPPLTNLTLYDHTPYGFVAREVVPDDRRGLI